MRISVILSTYNSPDWLEQTLWGYAAQTDHDFEVLIADDGSTADTQRRIDLLRMPTRLTIRHLWHEDRGFRKCEILNQALVAAAGDYVIFSDGDCIPRADFIATHRRLAEPGYFLSGGYFRLPMGLSRKLTREDIVSGRVHQAGWLLRNKLPLTPKLVKLLVGGRFAAILDAITPTTASWNGHNSSGWKTDLLAVNGFDERMEYGGEDRELGERLLHHGIRARRIRHRAIVVHLEHARGYVNAPALARNRAIWNETLRTHAQWTEYGVYNATRERAAA